MAGKGQAEGCASCAKWLLIIFNVLFCLLGVGMLAAGIYAYIQLRDYLAFLDNANVNVPAILLIVFGCFTFIIAALGCIGACKESPCLLFTFATIIGVLLVAEIGLGIAAFVMKDTVNDILDKNGPESLKNYNKSEGVGNSWDLLQSEFKCCGFVDKGDYGRNGLDIPDSCREKSLPTGQVFSKGCKAQLVKLVEDNIYIAAGVAVAFGVIELLGIVFACCVGCAARKGEYA